MKDHSIASRVWRKPWTAAAVATAALGILLLVFEIAPALADAGELLRIWRAQEARLSEVAEAPAEVATLEVEQRRLRRGLDDLLVSLPRQDQLSAVLVEVQQQAGSTGVVLVRLEPGEPVRRRTHEVLPIRVELSGSFHEVGYFIDRLERSPLLMQVKTVILQGNGSLGTGLEGTVELEAVRLGSATVGS